jgi:hypothetical protein
MQNHAEQEGYSEWVGQSANDDTTPPASAEKAAPQKQANLPFARVGKFLAFIALRLTNFVRRSVTEEWHAAVLSAASSIPTNILTAVSVVGLSPWCMRVTGSSDSWSYVALTSSLTVILGYVSYIAVYYVLMGYKERRDQIKKEGRFDFNSFKKVALIDFTLHLPYDFISMTRVGALQGGLLASGTSDLFWSILISQAIIDSADCLKESFYWRAAKETKALLDMRSGPPRNTDLVKPDTTPRVDDDRGVGNL